MDRGTKVFKYAILPEILGKYYSKLSSQPEAPKEKESSTASTSAQEVDESPKLWCYCRTDESGEMILCESEQCEIEWFHTHCLLITSIPKGKWICPDCRKERSTKRRRTK